jgi:hypothetical protein
MEDNKFIADLLKAAEVTLKKETQKEVDLNKLTATPVVDTDELPALTSLKVLTKGFDKVQGTLCALELTALVSKLEAMAKSLKDSLLPNANTAYRDLRDGDGSVCTNTIKASEYKKTSRTWKYSDTLTKDIEAIKVRQKAEETAGKASKVAPVINYYKDRAFKLTN